MEKTNTELVEQILDDGVTVNYVIKNGAACVFHSLRAGFIYYKITLINGKRYLFTVPIKDTDGATFHNTEKPVTLMRWIRKAIISNEFIETD